MPDIFISAIGSVINLIFRSTKRNRPILTTCKTIRNVVSSAAEAETTGTLCNAKEGVAILPSLLGIGHKQPPTPLKTKPVLCQIGRAQV